MESLSETEWDVVISGTGLQQSLLALALSRSNKKVLHVDQNHYYGGAEAAFSLQEAEEWVANVKADTPNGSFSSACIWNAENNDDVTSEFEKLSFSRAYTLSLAPQIIYTRSKLISQLISSKVYRQLEFQAVGNWWIYNAEETNSRTNGPADIRAVGTLRRIPSSREDVFSDNSINRRAKRSLMNFLKFVVDYENQVEVWEPHAETSLPAFLSASFNLPPSLQTDILALTLSLNLPGDTTVRYSLPRIARHLTSIGLFGPGFGAVIPKWGGASEIAQVACRAGAVGGGVYILGTGVMESTLTNASHIALTLSNDAAIQTKAFVNSRDSASGDQTSITPYVSKMIAVVSSDLASLFTTTVEGGPTAAVSVITFPSNSMIVDGHPQSHPVYIMAHSSDTGECPAGQCVLYVSSSSTSNPKPRLEAAISALLNCFSFPDPKQETTPIAKTSRGGRVLYNVYYEQRTSSSSNTHFGRTYSLAPPSLDLAFDDATLDNVEDAWKAVMGHIAGDESLEKVPPGSYMVFEEREQTGGQEDDYDGI